MEIIPLPEILTSNVSQAAGPSFPEPDILRRRRVNCARMVSITGNGCQLRSRATSKENKSSLQPRKRGIGFGLTDPPRSAALRVSIGTFWKINAHHDSPVPSSQPAGTRRWHFSTQPSIGVRAEDLALGFKNAMALRQAEKKKFDCPERSGLTWPSQTSMAHGRWQMANAREQKNTTTSS
ncbi:hypothetical protein MBM_01823 [Drepanopeziza brunnea f. sp. 'multigermtubi' MB_m1]|uniref:Uncharacterized protein n=1 Tax=Marssonina brunnea f. sp. multigermtubi (strain MB_m1) TaxID=1072389 RepID=K1X3Q2_MARBU|nr:uncharacterized protein MBM_01823 [Drepanopeziza brunnea f. sp. 'multigermtubi' MB_m1]EKD19871.1 hypothetical protein MBM_01823 [Drepanopeziza brunnea f. sp. 'multigermtubi' MB_m1]